MSYIRDTLRNFVTGLGMPGVDPTKSYAYDLPLLDRHTLENMYRGDWLARKIVDCPAEDMTREWREWQANQDQIEAIELVEKTLDLQRKVKQWIIKARLYGGSALVIGVDDGNDPSQPLDLEKCGKGCLKYVVVLHRFELNAGPRIYNVTDPYYTRAAYYTVATPMFGWSGEAGVTEPVTPGTPISVPGSINKVWQSAKNVVPFGRGKENQRPQYPNTTPTNLGMSQIHPSRVLELPGNELPDWRLAPLGGGWGDSVLQTVIDTMTNFTGSLQSIAAIISDSKLDVVKIPEMSQRLKDQDYKEQLINRFTLSAQTKSVISALLLDKEEEWERVQTHYAGLPMILHEFTTIIAAAADIPVSRLFGQAQGRGMQGGATAGGPDDLRNYYDVCVDQQNNEIAPRLGMLDQVLMRSALGRPDPNVNYEWNPLWQTSDADKAAIAFQKAQATQIYVSLGIINEDAFREGLVNQLVQDNVYPGLDDAIEEYGAEPEEPDPMEMGGGAGNVPVLGQKGEPRPNPEKTGHSGPMGDALFDEGPGHAFHGNQYTGGISEGSGKEADKTGQGQPLGKGYSKKAKLVGNTVHTSNVDDAVRALYEGRKVELTQPSQVSTLVEKLATKMNAATAEGQKATRINLCDVSVKGTNLFCAESKGIPRIKMPQLDKNKNKEFRQYLQKQGYKVTKDTEFASHLKATQDELDPVKAQKFVNKADEQGEKNVFRRIFISKDDYIVDGHHHWAGKIARDARNNDLTDNTKMKVARVNIPIIQLLHEADKFTGGKGRKGLSDAELFDWEPEDEGIDEDEEDNLFGHVGDAVAVPDYTDELREIKAMLEDSQREQPAPANLPPITVNLTMPSSRVKKTVTTHRDADGNLVAEVHEEDEE